MAAQGIVTGEEPGRHGSAHPYRGPFQTFCAADGWIYVAVWGARRAVRARLGEHTDAVLGEIGIGAAERARLRAVGVIA